MAVSDPTGTIARPLTVLRGVTTDTGFGELLEVVRSEAPDQIVVGLPLTLRGDAGIQAEETERFVEKLRGAVDVSVETYDERFTTALAESAGGDDAHAAAHLLSDYLRWSTARAR